MRFSAIAAAVATFVSVVSATVGSNGFTAPIAGDILTAGKPYTITWINLVGSTVSLSLRNGNVDNLNVDTIIAANIPNTGSYTWNIPATQVYGSDDTIAISWGTGTSDMNFSDRIILNSAFTSGVTVSTAVATSTSVSGTSSSVVSTTVVSTSSVSSVGTTATTSAFSASSTGKTTSGSTLTTSNKPSSASSATGAASSSSASANPTAPSSGTANLASPLAIVLCLFAAVMYTN